MFRWTHEERVPTTATAAQVWALWSKPETWGTWDDELEWVKLQGPFVVGTRGTMKPKGGPVVRFTMTSVEPGKGFSDRSHLPLTSLDFTHELADGALIHRVEMRGFLTPLFRRVIGATIARGLRGAMTKLARMAENA
jgi:hypothetical protein